MPFSDWVNVYIAIGTIGATLWGIASFLIEKKFDKDRQIEILKKNNSDLSIGSISSVLEEMKKRVLDWEMIQKNQTTATMQQFHSLELVMKDYQKDNQTII